VDGRLFPEELNIPVFMTIKNILLARHSLLATVTERSWRSRIQTHEKNVYQSVFKWLFRWLHPDIGVNWRNTSVKTNSFLVMRMWLFLVKTTNGLFCIQRKLETKHYNTLFLVTFTNERNTCRRNAEYESGWLDYVFYIRSFDGTISKSVLITRSFMIFNILLQV
jgi:hypothetical protein